MAVSSLQFSSPRSVMERLLIDAAMARAKAACAALAFDDPLREGLEPCIERAEGQLQLLSARGRRPSVPKRSRHPRVMQAREPIVSSKRRQALAAFDELLDLGWPRGQEAR